MDGLSELTNVIEKYTAPNQAAACSLTAPRPIFSRRLCTLSTHDFDFVSSHSHSFILIFLPRTFNFNNLIPYPCYTLLDTTEFVLH